MPYKDPERQRAYQREWVAKRRATWMKDKVCVDCGSDQDLEVDHADPSTKDPSLRGRGSMSKLWTWPVERRDAELLKCVSRCRPCHIEKSRVERPHGEASSRSILTEDQVRDARRRVAQGESQSAVARSLGVTRWCIYRLVHRKDWAYLE